MGLLVGCTTTTGTKVALSQTDLSNIRSLGVLVRAEKEFSVHYSRDQMTDAGVVLAGLVGGVIETGARDAADARRTKKLKPGLGDLNPPELLGERLRQHLQAANIFNRVESVGPVSSKTAKESANDQLLLKQSGLDGLLVVTIRQWGMSSCPESKAVEKIQISFDIGLKMLMAGRTAPAWERNEFYLGGDCHTVEEYSSPDGVLQGAFTRAIENFAGRLANEIRFPK